MPAVPLIITGISAVASIYAAKKQADAVKQAAKTQTDAATQAINEEKRQSEVNQAALNPAMSMFGPAPGGGGATGGPVGPLGTPAGQFGTLGDVYGKILDAQLKNLGPYQALGSGAAGALGFGMGLGGFQNGLPSTLGSSYGASGSGMLVPNDPNNPNFGKAYNVGAMRDENGNFAQGNAATSTGEPVPGQPNSGTVPMRAPNGEIQAVPANQVAHYLAQGAKRLELTA